MRLIEERRGSAVISYVYEPDSYVPLARLDAEGERAEQGGLGTTHDAQQPGTSKTIAASADQISARGPKHQSHPNSRQAANDTQEDRYWQALNPKGTVQNTGTDGPSASTKLCEVYYFHTDPSGLPEELSNAQGQIIWQAQYKTWEATVQESWEARRLHGVQGQTQGDIPRGARQEQNLRFQGQYLDRETGLHYNTFRYYDADIGRFISPDPIGLGGGINLGSYGPNPISWIDPWGWSPVCRMSGAGHSKASNLPVVRPGTKQWDEAVVALKNGGKGDIRVANAADAKAILKQARGGMDRRKMYSNDGDYGKGYQVHKPQPGADRGGSRLPAKERWRKGEVDGGIGNDRPHIKWKDKNGRDQGHIFFDD